MKVYDTNKTKILTEYDLTKGYLVNDTIYKYHAEQPAIKEVSHYETIKEYANGGKEVKKVIDVEGRPYKEAYTEPIDIMVYKPYTQKELYQQEINKLTEWYSTYYTHHEQKYRRLHSLGKLTDEGNNPYDELIKLYNEAEIKRARIQELERLISDSTK